MGLFSLADYIDDIGYLICVGKIGIIKHNISAVFVSQGEVTGGIYYLSARRNP